MVLFLIRPHKIWLFLLPLGDYPHYQAQLFADEWPSKKSGSMFWCLPANNFEVSPLYSWCPHLGKLIRKPQCFFLWHLQDIQITQASTSALSHPNHSKKTPEPASFLGSLQDIWDLTKAQPCNLSPLLASDANFGNAHCKSAAFQGHFREQSLTQAGPNLLSKTTHQLYDW